MGTPAEERGAGKQVLIERGAFKDIDVAMMVHPANSSNGQLFPTQCALRIHLSTMRVNGLNMQFLV